jgi:hypothetical protein
MKFVIRLCHNCDRKPVWTDKIDFFDSVRLLIPRKLLKIKMCPKNLAYRLIRHFVCCRGTAFVYCFLSLQRFISVAFPEDLFSRIFRLRRGCCIARKMDNAGCGGFD